MSDKQRTIWTAVLTVALLLVALALLYVTGIPQAMNATAIERHGIICDSGETNCVESYGMGFEIFKNASTTTPVFNVNPLTGDVYVRGVLTATAVMVLGSYQGNITPVATATSIEDGSGGINLTGNLTATALYVGGAAIVTPQPTRTPIAGGYTFTGAVVAPTLFSSGITANTGVFTTSVSVAGTPLPLPTATPQSAFWNGTAHQFAECHVTSAFTNTVAVTPVTSNATPVVAIPALAQAETGDAAHVTYGISGNVVTLRITGSSTTPTANTTPAAVGYCIYGTIP